MAVDPKVKRQIQEDYRLFKTPATELAEKYNVPYQTTAWFIRLAKEEDADLITEQFMAKDINIIKAGAEVAKDQIHMSPLDKHRVDEVVKSVSGIHLLERKSQNSAMGIYDHLQSYLDLQKEITLKDLKDAAEIVSKLHTAMFSKNITQVNVVNNTTVSGEKRDIFKKNLGV